MKKHVLFCGIRGSGKRALALALVDSYIKSNPGARKELVDFEDPRHAPGPRRETVDAYAKLANGSRHGVIAIFEIGMMPNWVDFISQIDRYSGIKFVFTVSGNSETVKKKIEENKNIDVFEVYPCGFSSFINGKNKGDIDRNLIDFLGIGAEPNESILNRFYRIILGEILLKHEIRDVKKLTDIAVYLLESSGSVISVNMIRRYSNCSLDMGRAFLGYLVESGMVLLVNRQEDIGRERNEAGRLCYAGDIELIRLASRGPPDPRKLALTAIYHELRRMRLSMLAWRQDGCEGLLVQKPGGEKIAIDCCWSDEDAALKRMARVVARYGAKKGFLLVRSAELKAHITSAGTVQKIPLEKWLLEPALGEETTSSADKRAEIAIPPTRTPPMPSHLL